MGAAFFRADYFGTSKLTMDNPAWTDTGWKPMVFSGYTSGGKYYNNQLFESVLHPTGQHHPLA
jgi:hypothetical protein